MKVLNVVGARPQFIKYFPISRALSSAGQPVNNVLVHTGQHYDYSMSKVFFDEFGIEPPHYHLEVGSGSHGWQTGEILKRVEEVLVKEKPDVVVVYGDTNSTLGGAVAAAKLNIPVAHVEAGLRSFNRRMPEETNRVLTDHVSSILFCPSRAAVTNLRKEGFENIAREGELIERAGKLAETLPPPVVMNVGDVMQDVLLYSLKIAEARSKILERLGLASKTYALLTMHRAENTDSPERYGEIVSFVNGVSASWDTILFPMHPRTRKVYESSPKKFSANVRVIDPVGYFDLLMLLKNSVVVLTDSGGMQKESYWLKVPCITLRDETEWVETIELGWNVLYKDYEGVPNAGALESQPYGDGCAAQRMVRIILDSSSNGKSQQDEDERLPERS